MGDASDFCIESGLDAYFEHLAGFCDGPCQYCEERPRKVRRRRHPMAAKPAIPLEKFLKGKEKKELEKKLARMAELKVNSKEIEFELKGDETTPGLVDDVASFLIGYGQDKVEYGGFVHAVLQSANVSYSKDKIQAALLRNGVDPDIIADVLQSSKTVTPYTTIVTTPVKEKAAPGGITGK